MTSNVNDYLENILAETGRCGQFQIVFAFFVLGIKSVVAWSVLMMSFGGAVPEWTCIWHTELDEVYMPNSNFPKQCTLENITSEVDRFCVTKKFDTHMSTIVNEWNLVCDREWVISTITTIQMGGLLIGALISGQLGDLCGRKSTYMFSLILLMVSNIIAAFSINWKMFAALRFFIGLSCGWYLTVFGIFLTEFIPLKFRSLALAFPAWAMGTMSFTLFAWILHDWKYIQIATAAFCLPWMLGFCFVPESYRWLLSHNKIDEGYHVIEKVSSVNRKTTPDKDKFFKIMEKSNFSEKGKTMSFVDLLKNEKLRKITFLLTVNWFSCGYGYYAISFGVDQLHGDLYLNMFLLDLVGVPSVIASFLSNCMGRKVTTMLLFILAGLAGIAVGILQLIDITSKGALINGFALSSKFCITTGWVGLWTLTSESYPTVVRNVGMGLNNAFSRVGAMVAPQLVFASKHIPGISYIILGVMFLLSVLCTFFLEETNNKALHDSIEITVKNKDDSLRGEIKEKYDKY